MFINSKLKFTLDHHKLHEEHLIMLETSMKLHKCTKAIVTTINMGAHMRRVVVCNSSSNLYRTGGCSYQQQTQTF